MAKRGEVQSLGLTPLISTQKRALANKKSKNPNISKIPSILGAWAATVSLSSLPDPRLTGFLPGPEGTQLPTEAAVLFPFHQAEGDEISRVLYLG